MKKTILLPLIIVFICNISISFASISCNSNSSTLYNSIVSQTDTLSTSDTLTKNINTTTQKNNSYTSNTNTENEFCWYKFLLEASYILGIFILFPLVIYTNINEKIKSSKSPEDTLRNDLSEEERNGLAEEVLLQMEHRLTEINDTEDSESMYTITNGRQGKYIKRGLEYINSRLQPTSEEINERIQEFSALYYDRTQRRYTGSNLLIGCGISVIALFIIMDVSMLLNPLTWIHLCGIVFYYLSSRAPIYAIEKRENLIGTNRLGFIGAIIKPLLAVLLAGMSIKHYISINGGPWERDGETELTHAIFYIGLIIFIVLVLGVFISLFGILNFLINYHNSFLLPFRSLDKWYEKHFTNDSQLSIA